MEHIQLSFLRRTEVPRSLLRIFMEITWLVHEDKSHFNLSYCRVLIRAIFYAENFFYSLCNVNVILINVNSKNTANFEVKYLGSGSGDRESYKAL